MPQIVLMSESAGEFVQLGKQRLNELKLKGLKYANAYVGLKYGYIIVQKCGGTERILIDNKPPYLIMDVLQVMPGDTVERYVPTQGGVTAEGFRPGSIITPPELGGLDLRQSSTQYQASGKYVYSTVSANYSAFNYCYLAVVVTDVTTGKMRFVYGGYSYVNGASESFCAFAPVGLAENGGENMAYSYRTTTSPTDTNKHSSVSVVLQNTETVAETQVWPFAGANGGHTNEVAQVMTMANAGRMKVAWFQEYENTLGPGPAFSIVRRGDDPEIVVYNAQAGTYARTKLRDLTPELSAIFDSDPDAYQKLHVTKDIAYCGSNTLVIVFKYNNVPGAEKIYMFRSLDSGSTWAKITLPVSNDEMVNGGTFNAHALRSLKPGVLMFQTTDNIAVRLYHSIDHGLSWTSAGIVDQSVGSRQPGKYLISMQAVRNKLGRAYVYCATHHDAAGNVQILTYDDFSPTAALIGTHTPVSAAAAYTPISTRFNLAAYAERSAPLLQGYTDELEKGVI